MRLATDTAVVSLLGVADSDGTKATAQAALDATGPAIAEKLGTALLSATYTDFFSYRISPYRRTFTPVVLRLAAGFVDKDTFVARQSTDGAPLSSAGGGAAIDPALYILDAEQGTVTLLDDVMEGTQTVVFSYDAGFAKGDPLKGLPDWLTQAGALAAAKLVHANPANAANRKVSIMKDIQSVLLGEVSLLLNPHIRLRGGVVFPDRTVTE